MAYQSKHTGTTIDNSIDQMNQLLNIFYPIGSIYTSTKSASPATLFGGTWVQIKDTFLLTAGDIYSAGTTGGAANHTHTTAGHTLTIDEMPKHSHRGRMGYNQSGHGYTAGAWEIIADSLSSPLKDTSSNPIKDINPRPIAPTSSDGGGASHSHGNTGSSSNLPPYRVVYAWERTA